MFRTTPAIVFILTTIAVAQRGCLGVTSTESSEINDLSTKPPHLPIDFKPTSLTDEDTSNDELSRIFKRSPAYSFGLGKRRAYTYLSEYKRLPVYNFGLGKRSPKPYEFGIGKRSVNEDDAPIDDEYSNDESDNENMNWGNEVDSEDAGDNLEDNDLYDIHMKRARPYGFGLGKRDADKRRVYEFGLGKRAAYEFGLGKRLPSYEFGLGKRAAYEFGLGKRMPSYQFGLGKKAAYEFGLGKRLPSYEFGLGKRAAYEFGLGKRAAYEFGLGKRAGYEFGLGKRAGYEFGLGKKAAYDFGLGKRAAYEFGLGKRAAYEFGLGKKSDQSMYGKRLSHFFENLGKRQRDLNRFNFGLGKRSIPEQDDYEDFLQNQTQDASTVE